MPAFPNLVPLPNGLRLRTFNSTHTISASTSSIEWVFQADRDFTVSTINAYCTAVTGTSPTYRLSIQSVDSTLRANGILGSGTAYGDVTPSSANTVQTATLGTPLALTRGQIIAVVVAYQSGTISGSASATFSAYEGDLVHNFPHVTTVSSGTATRRTNGPFGVWLVDGSSNVMGFPAAGTQAYTLTSSSTPREVASRWLLPGSSGNYKIAGLHFYSGNGISGTVDLDGILYVGSATTDTTAAAAKRLSITAPNSNFQALFFDSEITVAAGSAIRCAARGQNTGSWGAIAPIMPTSTAVRAFYGGLDIARGGSTRVSGNWTDVDHRIDIYPIISATPDGGGSTVPSIYTGAGRVQ